MRSPCGPVRCCRTWNSFSSIRWGLLSPGCALHGAAAAGDYGRLYNATGESIYEKYGIEERRPAEKARDRLSQALFKEIYREGREVWLDLTGVSDKQWTSDPLSASTLGTIGKRCGRLPMGREGRAYGPSHHGRGVHRQPAGRPRPPGFFAAGEVTGGCMAPTAWGETP